ncbi:MAG: 3-deoxy-8-phosphooctulonate synthase [Nitrospiraceae bacterium]
MSHEVELGAFKIGGAHKHVLIAGPCVIESEQLVLETAHRIAEIARALRIPYIFKSSYDKANRSSISSFRGPGLTAGIAVLRKVKDQVGVPILTDIHSAADAMQAADGADILQIPAFLCRQTDLLVAAAKTGKIVNVKKGQFLSPWEMGNVVKKLEESGATGILLTERGSSFGYNNLVVDMRSLPVMRGFGYPVIFDATHSVQLPGGAGTRSSGQREFVAPLACAAAAAGCDGFFMEVHPHPDTALSDGPNMVPLSQLKPLLEHILRVCDASGKGPQVML